MARQSLPQFYLTSRHYTDMTCKSCYIAPSVNEMTVYTEVIMTQNQTNATPTNLRSHFIIKKYTKQTISKYSLN